MKLIVGAYAAAVPGWSTTQLLDFYAGLAGLPGIAGLELPAAQLETLVREPAAARALPAGWRYEITSLPATMSVLGSSPEFGLASACAAGRAAAIAAAEAIRVAVGRYHDLLGRTAVRSVTLVSAPGHSPATGATLPAPEAALGRAAFADSLATLAGRDWSGATLAVEHCDAAMPGQVPAKGFLSLDDELQAVAAVQGAGTPVRLVINWARSVIEQRDPSAAARHAARARDGRLLGGVVLSGCAPTESAWGPPWADTHLPPSDVRPPEGAAHASLLTTQRMTDFLRAGGPGTSVSLKVAVRPREADQLTRHRFVVASIDAVQRAWAAAFPAT